MKNKGLFLACLTGLAISQFCPMAPAQEPKVGLQLATDTEAQSRMERAAIAFLRQSQGTDGSFSSQAGPGVTGLVAAALLSTGVPGNDPMVEKAISYLLNTKRPDGGLYAEGSRHANYETCLAIMALSKANQAGTYSDILKTAQRFVQGEQWDEGEGIGPKDPAFGGAGYGSKRRGILLHPSSRWRIHGR